MVSLAGDNHVGIVWTRGTRDKEGWLLKLRSTGLPTEILGLVDGGCSL